MAEEPKPFPWFSYWDRAKLGLMIALGIVPAGTLAAPEGAEYVVAGSGLSISLVFVLIEAYVNTKREQRQ